MEKKFTPIEREGYTLVDCDLEYLLNTLGMNEYSKNILTEIAKENKGKVKCCKNSVGIIEHCSQAPNGLKRKLSDVLVSNIIHSIYGIDTDDSSYMKVRE